MSGMKIYRIMFLKHKIITNEILLTIKCKTILKNTFISEYQSTLSLFKNIVIQNNFAHTNKTMVMNQQLNYCKNDVIE